MSIANRVIPAREIPEKQFVSQDIYDSDIFVSLDGPIIESIVSQQKSIENNKTYVTNSNSLTNSDDGVISLNEKQKLIADMHKMYSKMEYLFRVAGCNPLILPIISTDMLLQDVQAAHEWLYILYITQFPEPHHLRQLHDEETWKMLIIYTDLREVRLFNKALSSFKRYIDQRMLGTNKVPITLQEITDVHRSKNKQDGNTNTESITSTKRDEQKRRQPKHKARKH